MNLASVRGIINEFLEQDLKQRARVETVVLCGSFATGKASTHSDVDLCYIGEFPEFKRESTVYQGREFQLMMAPWSWYEHVVLEFERKGTNIGTITVMLATGVCLMGDHAKWRALKANAESAFHKGPEPPSAEEVRKIRIRLIDLWEDFHDTETEIGRKWLAAELLQECVKALFLLRNWWAVKPKYQMQEIQTRDPQIGSLVTRCMDALGSKDELHTLCSHILGPIGGWTKGSL